MDNAGTNFYLKHPHNPINCGHQIYPFVPGVSRQTYFPYDKKENDELYRKMQGQRELERRVRKSKRECMTLEKLGDTEGLTKASATLKQRQQALKQYCSDNGLSYKPDRTAVVGYNRAVAGKVRKSLTSRKNKSIIKSIDIDDFEMMSEGKEIDPQAISIISSVIKRFEDSGEVYINDFYFGSLPREENGIPLLQIEPTGDKTLRLNINTDIFSGKTVAEINEMLRMNEKNLANSLDEATIHECGHAKALKGLKISEINTLYEEIADEKIEGVSDIAYQDGAEALAEIEVLISRGSDVPEKAMVFYNKHMRRKKK